MLLSFNPSRLVALLLVSCSSVIGTNSYSEELSETAHKNVASFLSAQNGDGSWGEGQDREECTATVAEALIAYAVSTTNHDVAVRTAITKASKNLRKEQMSQGSAAHYAVASVQLSATDENMDFSFLQSPQYLTFSTYPTSLSAKFLEIKLSLQQGRSNHAKFDGLLGQQEAISEFQFFDRLAPESVQPHLRRHLRLVLRWAETNRRTGSSYLPALFAAEDEDAIETIKAHAYEVLSECSFLYRFIGPNVGPYFRLTMPERPAPSLLNEDDQVDVDVELGTKRGH